ncbi:MAG TPA: penicillin-binding transpeptidase domain-containing protein [Ktedonobacteraceae bacterium]|nr:penicillin-binding transpeptidase domain-containing protein [Ktedonobacteraceae bacterium]
MNISASIRRLTILFVVLFIAVSGGLVYWQVVVAQQVTSNNYSALQRRCLADTTPKRGRIFDRNGVLLADSQPVAANNPNGGILCVYQRHYYYPSMANIIGYYVSPLFCSISPYCSSGIEKQFDDYLSGRNGITGLNNTVNNLLHVPPQGDDIYLTIDIRMQNIVYNDFDIETPRNGPNDDSVFQTYKGSVIVTDPKTGEILAMVSRSAPNGQEYDPNRIASGDQNYLNQLLKDPNQPLIDRAIDTCYVPGSTYKTMTLAAALDSQTFNLDDKLFYNDKNPNHMQAIGPVTIGSGNDSEVFGPVGNNIQGYTTQFPVNLRYGYSHSDNIIFAQVGAKVGVDTWLKYNSAFYVGRQIPFDLPVRVSTVTPQSGQNLCSYTPPAQTPLDVKQLAENAFGQGVDFVTPMQMSLLNSTVANNGHMMRPTLISKIVDPNGTVLQSFTAQELGTPISEQTAVQVRDAMYGVVACGSGSLIRVQLSYPYSKWSVIGKTGTGQVPQTNPNQITPAESWFITQAPYQFQSGQIPTLAITAMKENGGEGAYANGPMLRDLYQAFFTQIYKNVPQPPAPPTNFCFTTGLLQ